MKENYPRKVKCKKGRLPCEVMSPQMNPLERAFGLCSVSTDITLFESLGVRVREGETEGSG